MKGAAPQTKITGNQPVRSPFISPYFQFVGDRENWVVAGIKLRAFLEGKNGAGEELSRKNGADHLNKNKKI